MPPVLTTRCVAQSGCVIRTGKQQEQSLKSRAIKGKERGVAVGGCRSSVAERWQLKPEALGSIPGGTTFLSFLLPFQRSTYSNGTDCLLFTDHYWSSDCGGVPSIGLPMLWLRSPSLMINYLVVMDQLFYGCIENMKYWLRDSHNM